MVIDFTTEKEHAATITRDVTLKMEAAGFPETQISIYKTTWHYLPEAIFLHLKQIGIMAVSET